MNIQPIHVQDVLCFMTFTISFPSITIGSPSTQFEKVSARSMLSIYFHMRMYTNIVRTSTYYAHAHIHCQHTHIHYAYRCATIVHIWRYGKPICTMVTLKIAPYVLPYAHMVQFGERFGSPKVAYVHMVQLGDSYALSKSTICTIVAYVH